MIKGTGSLQVSAETVAVAMQEYLDKRVTEGVVVTSVRATMAEIGAPATFEVAIAEKKAPVEQL
jgi:hypothetical protein